MPSAVEYGEARPASSSPKASEVQAEVNSPKREQIEGKLIGIRSSTPNTHLATPRWNPDISIYCHSCQQLVPATKIVPHKRFHKELGRFQLADQHSSTAKGVTMEMLGDARKRRLRQLAKRRLADGEETVSSVAVEKVNEAYSFLKSFLFDEPKGGSLSGPKEMAEIPAYDVMSKGLRCSVSFVLGAGVASYSSSSEQQQHQRSSRKRRSFATFQDNFGGDLGKCYVGLFDGSFGHHAAKLASEELHHFLLCELHRFDPSTTCTCALNMAAFDTALLTGEIHRPRTADTERKMLHKISENVVQQVIYSCQENLDSMAVDYSRGKTPDKSWRSWNNPTDEEQQLLQHQHPDSQLWQLTMSAAFSKALHYVDGLLKRGQDDRATVRWSGASVSALLLREEEQQNHQQAAQIGWLHAANAGNNVVLMLRNNTATLAAPVHSLRSRSERNRVAAASRPSPSSTSSPTVVVGDDVDGSGARQLRVRGLLPATRGVGYHGDPELKRLVLAEPDCCSWPISSECQAVVMTTPSVAGVLSVAEIGQIVSMLLPVNRLSPEVCLSPETKDRLGRPCFTEEEEEEEEVEPEVELSDDELDAAAESPPSCQSPPPSSASRTTLGSALDPRSRSAGTPSALEEAADAPDCPVVVAEEAALSVAQAALMAGCQGDIAVTVLLMPAAMGLL